jgi:hypothetical protein
VELPEGLRIVTRLSDPDRVRAGCRVHLVLETLQTDQNDNEIVTYAFAPSE